MLSALSHPAPIDPFTPLARGAYRDAMVEVWHAHGGRSRGDRTTIRTAHFDLTPSHDRVRVAHVVRPDEVDDDLAGLLAEELFRPGWLRGSEMFERLFTGVIRSLDPDPFVSWGAFYRNTLARAAAGDAAPATAAAHGTIADYAPVWEHAEQLVEALVEGSVSVLELGSRFGFLALRLAGAGHLVTASDVSAGTVGLLARIAPTLGVRVGTLVADAAHVPVPDATYDAVLALHLLEHLDPDHGERVLAEALRVARRRVVVAVPLEDVVDDTWGHVRTVSLADLDALGRATGSPYDVHDHHGGWLVVDR